MTLTYCEPNVPRRRAAMWDIDMSGRRLNWRLLTALSVNCVLWVAIIRLAAI